MVLDALQRSLPGAPDPTALFAALGQRVRAHPIVEVYPLFLPVPSPILLVVAVAIHLAHVVVLFMSLLRVS